MTYDQFSEVLEPLKNRHPNHFTPSVAAEIYRIIGHLNFHQGREIVGKLMLRSRYAPVEEDFKGAITELFRPKQYVPPSKEDYSFDEIFTDKERQENWNFLRRVLRRVVSTEEYETTIEVLKNAIKSYEHNKR